MCIRFSRAPLGKGTLHKSDSKGYGDLTGRGQTPAGFQLDMLQPSQSRLGYGKGCWGKCWLPTKRIFLQYRAVFHCCTSTLSDFNQESSTSQTCELFALVAFAQQRWEDAAMLDDCRLCKFSMCLDPTLYLSVAGEPAVESLLTPSICYPGRVSAAGAAPACLACACPAHQPSTDLAGRPPGQSTADRLFATPFAAPV